jgi:hypothetical protein
MSVSALNAEQLQSAFAIFNQHSSQLEQSYRELQDTVELLTTQLGEARSARLAELVKKEQLSNRLGQLLETLPGAIVVIDGEGCIQEHNSEAVALLGEPLSGFARVAVRMAISSCATGAGWVCRDGHCRTSRARFYCLPTSRKVARSLQCGNAASD